MAMVAKYAAKKMMDSELQKYKDKRVDSPYVSTTSISNPPTPPLYPFPSCHSSTL